MTVYSKNESSQCNLTAQIEQVFAKYQNDDGEYVGFILVQDKLQYELK
jgi:hypothetical protein